MRECTVAKLSFKLLGINRAVYSFAVRIEYGVRADLSLSLGSRPCVYPDEYQGCYDKVHCTKFVLDRDDVQSRPQQKVQQIGNLLEHGILGRRYVYALVRGYALDVILVL